MTTLIALALALALPSTSALSQAQTERPVLDITLSNYNYPFDVHYINIHSQNQDLKMAYMDVHPPQPNGKTVVLLHGKNFNAAYWKTTIDALTRQGYRVIAPDQIGFGKSDKPAHYQFTFQQLAQNTKAILDSLNINKIYLLGHSMGGMLATRFTLMYPGTVEKLVLESPIGLEDWKLKVPYISIDENYKTELRANHDTLKQYELESYYAGHWKPEYDEWVYLQTAWAGDKDFPIVAMDNALTSDMIFTQPVCYEFQNIKTPTLLIIGTRDRTAIGRQYVSPEVGKTMGQYQNLGKETRRKIPNSQLVELDNVGHAAHIEAFDRFIQPLLQFLNE